MRPDRVISTFRSNGLAFATAKRRPSSEFDSKARGAPAKTKLVTRTTPKTAAVSGRSERIRRAARLGDGWHPINLTPAELEPKIGRYRDLCAEHHRPPGPVILRHMPGGRSGDRTVLTGSLDEQAGDIRAYAEAGLDELMLSIAAPTPEQLIDTLAAFRNEVVPRAIA